jgi:hypothetical protein
VNSIWYALKSVNGIVAVFSKCRKTENELYPFSKKMMLNIRFSNTSKVG